MTADYPSEVIVDSEDRRERRAITAMLPDLPRDRFLQIGNAAGHGAVLVPASSSERMLCEEIA